MKVLVLLTPVIVIALWFATICFLFYIGHWFAGGVLIFMLASLKFTTKQNDQQ